jgi:hypothetical protein
MPKNAVYWIEKLQLSAHPEGGYFRETYRSQEQVRATHLPVRFDGDRSFSTAIYFLLESHQVSAFHRIKSDEMWHFYAGSSLTIYVIDQQGKLSQVKLGNYVEKGEAFQAVVPAGYWFGAAVSNAAAYALVGCTVAPGFNFNDFEMAERAQLLKEYPQHESIISKLTNH